MQVTLTTTGYGDFYPVSAWGRFIAGIFMLLCMVTLSLPISVVRVGEKAGLITGAGALVGRSWRPGMR
jgi:hypothetical protein